MPDPLTMSSQQRSMILDRLVGMNGRDIQLDRMGEVSEGQMTFSTGELREIRKGSSVNEPIVLKQIDIIQGTKSKPQGSLDQLRRKNPDEFFYGGDKAEARNQRMLRFVTDLLLAEVDQDSRDAWLDAYGRTKLTIGGQETTLNQWLKRGGSVSSEVIAQVRDIAPTIPNRMVVDDYLMHGLGDCMEEAIDWLQEQGPAWDNPTTAFWGDVRYVLSDEGELQNEIMAELRQLLEAEAVRLSGEGRVMQPEDLLGVTVNFLTATIGPEFKERYVERFNSQLIDSQSRGNLIGLVDHWQHGQPDLAFSAQQMTAMLTDGSDEDVQGLRDAMKNVCRAVGIDRPLTPQNLGDPHFAQILAPLTG